MKPCVDNLVHNTDTAQVIKALYDYVPPADAEQCLPFSAGDFLHVVSREDADDWYEACNPLKNERGLVPVQYFENVGKTVRDSAESTKSASATHDSGYAEGTIPAQGRVAGAPGVPAFDPSMTGHRSSKSVSKVTGGVYGIVVYDFHAERPDELDAKEGEAIVVIAQSNPEWFVAKPISRLGGPGLIPVSFIEIRDMTTGRAVEDPLEAVRKANVPKVEEWKRIAAEYKNTSIPLGTVSSSQQIQNMQAGMQRMSLNNGQQNGNSHSSKDYALQQQRQQNLFAPVRASVPKYIFADEKFHFIVECKLSNGTQWDLSRIYEDFYELQINLINAFPEEAGQVSGKARILPYMPGPVKFVTDNISEGRRASLNEYLRDLLQLNQQITCSSLVRNFFSPRQGDYEVDPAAVDLEEHARTDPSPNRYSSASQTGLQNGAYQQPQQARQPPADSAYQNYQSQPQNGFAQQRSQQSLQSNPQEQRGHSRSPSSSIQQPPPPSHTPQQSINASGTSVASSGAPVKVKAWFDRDTCVVLRMPPRGQFNHSQLLQKIRERRRLEYKGEDPESSELDSTLR